MKNEETRVAGVQDGHGHPWWVVLGDGDHHQFPLVLQGFIIDDLSSAAEFFTEEVMKNWILHSSSSFFILHSSSDEE